MTILHSFLALNAVYNRVTPAFDADEAQHNFFLICTENLFREMCSTSIPQKHLFFILSSMNVRFT